MFCTNCGSEVNKNDKFCSNCGFRSNYNVDNERIADDGNIEH